MKLKFIGAMLLGAVASWGVSLDLNPGSTAAWTTGNANSGNRGAFFTPVSGFSIGQAGIWMDPLTGGATTLQVQIFSASGDSSSGFFVGSSLGSATASISDIGQALYNVPVNFTFTAGQIYYLAFDVTVPPGSFGSANDLEYYLFDYRNNSPFTVAGMVQVLDGGQGNNSNNFVLPHIVLNTEAVTSGGSGGGQTGGGQTGGGQTGGGNETSGVPEPSTYVLMMSALAIPALRRMKR